MMMIHLVHLIVRSVTGELQPCLKGDGFLEGIRAIIGQDPNLPHDELVYKPFVGSFSTFKPGDDLSGIRYCLTDNACGHYEAYSQDDVPLEELACDRFCFIDPRSRYFVASSVYTPANPPPEGHLNCGWETCG